MELLKIMVDAVKGVETEYSKAQTSEAIRNALIEMNGGSNKINLKDFYRGSELFALVEELLPVIVNEGFKDEDPIFSLVDYRNIADGDEQEFTIEGNGYFVVADAAAGVKGVRRQRIDNAQSLSVKTTVKVVRVYEELNRLLSGKVSFDKFVEKVGESFKQAILADAYKAISLMSNTTIGLDATYVTGGSTAGAEDAVMALIEHVEAATGKLARILGTKSALKKLPMAAISNLAKDNMYQVGYYGKFNGTDMICMKQAHVPGTTTFALPTNKLFIIASDDKPVKVVNEGQGILSEGDPFANADLTKEYFYGQGFGVGVACSNKMGIFTFSD